MTPALIVSGPVMMGTVGMTWMVVVAKRRESRLTVCVLERVRRRVEEKRVVLVSVTVPTELVIVMVEVLMLVLVRTVVSVLVVVVVVPATEVVRVEVTKVVLVLLTVVVEGR